MVPAQYRRLLAAVALVLVLGGCGATAPAPAAPVDRPTASAATPAAAGSPLGESRPERLVIPTLDVDSALMDLRLRADDTMEVPPDATTTGWYVHSPTPGEVGPAVLAAHVDWRGEPGVFHRLGDLVPGDQVRVAREDGTTAVFAVERVEQYAKDAFPTDLVYGDVDRPELRLITCGGEFDDDAGHYEDNLVAYARLVDTA